MSLGDAILRAVLSAGHRLLRAAWFVQRPHTHGSHAFALTPAGHLILVRLRYAPGWRLPGGGRRANEDAATAVLRELREEIGMVSHGTVRLARELEQAVHFKKDRASLLVVEDVRYSPRWSWEVEKVIEAPLDDLPQDLAPIAREWIEEARASL